MTSARKQDIVTVKNIFSHDNLLPETQQFESALEKRSDLHFITYKLLSQKLASLRTDEFEKKLVVDQKNYAPDAAKSVMQDATKIFALLNLFMTVKTRKTKEEVREKLIDLYNQFKINNDLALLKQNIQDYFNANNLESKDGTLNDAQLNKAIAAPCNVGVLWGNDYGNSEEMLYQKLAMTFFKITRVDAYEVTVNAKVTQQMLKIHQLKNELEKTVVANPLQQLVTILDYYKLDLEATVNKYDGKTYQSKTPAIVASTKKATDTIIRRYEKSISGIKERINLYPESLEEALTKVIKDAKDRPAELKKVKSRLLAHKSKLLDECTSLNTQLSNEKQTLISEIKAAAIPACKEQLPDIKKLEQEIDTLQTKITDPKQMMKLTFNSLLDYQTKLNQLSENTDEFCRKLQEERESSLNELILNLETSFKELILAAQSINQLNLSDAKLDATVTQSLENATSNLSIQRQSLSKEVASSSLDISKQFALAIKSVQYLCKVKKSERERLINDIAEELKLTIPTKAIDDHFLKQLPDLLTKKTAESKKKMHELHQNAENQLLTKNREILLNACEKTLNDFDCQIKKLQTNFDLSDQKKQLEDKNIDLFLGKILKNIQEDEAVTDLAKKRQIAEETQRRLEEAKKVEDQARAGESSKTIAAAEKERMHAEQLNNAALLTATASESVLKNIQLSPITTPKESSYREIAFRIAKGVLAGLASMIVAPIAWFYGAYQLGKEVKQKYQSTGWGIAAGAAAFIVMPMAWFFGGMRIGQAAAGEINTGTAEEIKPLLSLDSPTASKTPKDAIEFSPIKLPTISMQEQFKLVCSKQKIELKSSQSELQISTQPKMLHINEKGTLSIKDTKKDIIFSNAATILVKRILNELNHPDDLKIDVGSNGLIKLDIVTNKISNHFYLSAGNTGDQDLLYVDDKNDAKLMTSMTSLLPKQFSSENLKTLLYQSPSPIPVPDTKATPHRVAAAGSRFDFKG